jgi:hypothetical protein
MQSAVLRRDTSNWDQLSASNGGGGGTLRLFLVSVKILFQLQGDNDEAVVAVPYLSVGTEENHRLP